MRLLRLFGFFVRDRTETLQKFLETEDIQRPLMLCQRWDCLYGPRWYIFGDLTHTHAVCVSRLQKLFGETEDIQRPLMLCQRWDCLYGPRWYIFGDLTRMQCVFRDYRNYYYYTAFSAPCVGQLNDEIAGVMMKLASLLILSTTWMGATKVLRNSQEFT